MLKVLDFKIKELSLKLNVLYLSKVVIINLTQNYESCRFKDNILFAKDLKIFSSSAVEAYSKRYS